MRRIVLTMVGTAGLLLSIAAPAAAYQPVVRVEPPVDARPAAIAAPSRPTRQDLSTPGATTYSPGGLRGF